MWPLPYTAIQQQQQQVEYQSKKKDAFLYTPYREKFIYTYFGEAQGIALFTDNLTHLHYNTIQRVHEAILGYFAIFARNCFAFAFNFTVIQM